MEQVDLLRLIDRSNYLNPHRLIEKGPDPSFSRKFSEELTNFIILSSAEIPKVSTEVLVEREGSFGILPSPARKAAAQAILTGEPVVPLRVREETSSVGELECLIDKVSLHAIVEIDPRIAADQEEQKAIIDTLLSIWQTVSVKNPTFREETSTGAPVSVRAKEIQGVLHLIKKGVVGSYNYEELPINLPADLQKALSSIQQGLSWVLEFHPNDTPKSDALVHEILDSQIKKAVEEDNGERQICVPICFEPKIPNYIPTINPLFLIRPGEKYPMTILNRK